MSQAPALEGWGATDAVAIAVTPIATPPHPGTAVKDAAFSMVSRIKRRSSTACVCSGAGRRRRERTGPAQGMSGFIPERKIFVKYFIIQSSVQRRIGFDPGMRRSLSNSLAEPQPLPEVGHLTDVVAFVKRQERDLSADLAVQCHTFGDRCRQRFRRCIRQRYCQVARHLIPNWKELVDPRVLAVIRELGAPNKELFPRSRPFLSQ